MIISDTLTVVSVKRLEELLRKEKAADALREGLEYSYQGFRHDQCLCELCRCIRKYDKDVKSDLPHLQKL
jgi:hypothetical protein